MNGFTKVYHKKSYDRIDPRVQASSQHGRTILITGGSEGIGYGIAQGFARAKASRIILVARNETKLDAASTQLKSGYQSTEILTKVCDCADVEQLKALFAHLSSQAIFVDVLILNAGATSNTTTAAEVAAVFHFNVVCKIHLLELFQNQKLPNGDSTPRKIAIEISSASVHCYGGYPRTAYPSSKAGFANYLCHMAEHVPETELRLLSLHPGAIFTAASAAASPMGADSPFWDHGQIFFWPDIHAQLADDHILVDLPSHMAVWLASDEAAFLHGRYVWANWDVGELVELKEKIIDNKSLLKVGIIGVPSFTLQDLIKSAAPPAKE